MDKTTYNLRNADRVDDLCDYFFVGDLGPTVAVIDGNRITLTERQERHLRALPDDHDGHIDADGVMWIGGTGYPPEGEPTGG